MVLVERSIAIEVVFSVIFSLSHLFVICFQIAYVGILKKTHHVSVCLCVIMNTCMKVPKDQKRMSNFLE